MTTTFGRRFIAAVFAVQVFAPSAPAQSAAAADIAGVYSGRYDGPEGTTTFTLSLTGPEARGRLTGVFTSYLAGASDAVVSTNDLAGSYIAASHRIQLSPSRSRTVPRSNLTLMAISGTYDPNAGQLSGMIVMSRGRRIKFEATRDAAESTKLASVSPTPAASSAAPTPPTRPRAVAPVRRPTAAPAVAQAVAPMQGTATTIDGVYNGTFKTWRPPGWRTLKLALRTFDHGTLAGIFTLYDPPTSHDRAYSYSLTGTFESATGKFNLEPAKWLTPAPGYHMVGITGTFDANAGKVTGNLTGDQRSPFEVTRAAAESANIAQLITAPAGPAAAATELAWRPPVVQGPKPPSCNGVYTGTCGCVTGKINAKLVLKETDPGVVTGFLTMELPPDVGSTATFKLNGTWRSGVVQAGVSPWGARAPVNYALRLVTLRNMAGMGVMPTHLLGNLGGHDCSDIDVFRDEAESANLEAVLAESEQATNAVTVAKAAAHAEELEVAHAAALEAQAAKIKAAAPAQLASKDLVRKSQKYWSAYRADLIREIFDGGFGDYIDHDIAFKILFTTYVELFAKQYHDLLPADAITVTISKPTVIRTYADGSTRRFEGWSYSVDTDPRFALYYRAYALSMDSPGQALVGAINILSGKAGWDTYTGPASDMEHFFETETGRSAAMRQMGENLLRAAANDLSLQQAGEKIAGAAAETDKDLPPGRYARFVDGCNGYFGDPANGQYARSGPWCQCLAAKYKNLMTRDEEYYYANDFQARFLKQIVASHSTDPAWSRLHQATIDCLQ